MSANLNTLPGRAQRRRRGLTLIEAAMVLVILALVVGAVMLYYQSANQNRQISAVAGQLAATQQAVRSAYAGQADLSDLENTSITRYLPASMVVGGATATTGELRHAFNGRLTVDGRATGGTYFTVTLANIPYDACKRLATMDMGRATLGLAVGSVATDTSVQAPHSRAAAETECGTTGTKTMSWAFQ